ncbi:DUF2088 domain-containing protein [candidate division KSB1 bacterium]|nr:DUF2088 domain-containing protein [candidate division KSB1 bacterium]
MLIGKGITRGSLPDETVREFCAQAFEKHPLRNKRVLVIIPDHTRTAPIPLFFKLFHELIGDQVAKLDYLVALGTHPPLSEAKLMQLVGITKEERHSKYANIDFYNHQWDDPAALETIGRIGAEEIEFISNGLMREEVPVALNKHIFEYDHLLLVGPTFPHEVVGFSGGNKYLFPGIGGPDIIHFFHWLGAVITNPVINGTKDTPVRRVVDKAATFLKIPRLFFSLVVFREKLSGLFIGSPEEAWLAAADLSSKLHIVYVDKSFHKVLGIAPEMYDEIWTAGKVMYKLEPIIADGGELIIYGPHIKEVSFTHGKLIDQIGYHVRDYFLSRMDHFSHIPRGILAHSTHVKGIGRFVNGREEPRVNVFLATGIPKTRCEQINLGYINPAEIDPDDWANREAEGYLLVRKAGEMLYRLADGTVPEII